MTEENRKIKILKLKLIQPKTLKIKKMKSNLSKIKQRMLSRTYIFNPNKLQVLT